MSELGAGSVMARGFDSFVRLQFWESWGSVERYKSFWSLDLDCRHFSLLTCSFDEFL